MTSFPAEVRCTRMPYPARRGGAGGEIYRRLVTGRRVRRASVRCRKSVRSEPWTTTSKPAQQRPHASPSATYTDVLFHIIASQWLD